MSAKIPYEADDIYIGSYILFQTLESDTDLHHRSVKIEPKPIVGKHYFLLTDVCERPGFQSPGGGVSSVWDCGQSFGFSHSNGGLPTGPYCLTSNGSPHGSFDYQNNVGPVNQSVLVFPSGTGYPVGGKTGHDFVVLIFHFPSKNKTMDGTTGVSGTDITFARTLQPMTPVSSLIMNAQGFVGPKSVGSVNGVFDIRQKDVAIHPFALYTHWHDLATHVEVTLIHSDGEEEVLVRQDPHRYFGVTNITNWPSIVARTGDRITLTCTYNNTLTAVLRVQ